MLWSMLILDRIHLVLKRSNRMKKLMTVALALAFLGATVAVSFAQDTPKKEAGRKSSKKKSNKKKEETPKKGGGV